MSNLKNKIIKLAYTQPEIRPHLLPIIKEASSFEDAVKGRISVDRIYVEEDLKGKI